MVPTLSAWPWENLGPFKYLIYGPFLAQVLYSRTQEDSMKNNWCLHILIICFLRACMYQLWNSCSSMLFLNRNRRILEQGVDFKQIDKEWDWDNFVILQALMASIACSIFPFLSNLPLWDSRSLIVAIIFHMGVSEPIYYWAHKGFHGNYLFTHYHSFHHSSPVPQPFTGKDINFQICPILRADLIRERIVSEEGDYPSALAKLQQWITLGKFKSKTCYDYFRAKGFAVCWAKLVWHRSLLPKHAFILWLGLKGRLLTRDKMIDQIEDTSCIFCHASIESVNHLFFQCSEVNQVWTEIKRWLGFSRVLTTIKAAAKWIHKEARGTGPQAIAKKVGYACTVYNIWTARNVRMFEGKNIPPADIIRDIKIQVYRVLQATFPNIREL